MLHFGEDFVWGAATAAHQVEGNNVASDWWAREHAAGSPVAEPSLDACDSFHRYPEDMRLLADAGLGAYRFSVEWARIEPEPGRISRAMLDHYRRMIDTALGLGLEPIVTLHHFTAPAWFARGGPGGGWLAADATERFGDYVGAVAPILSGVSRVCTINEPNMVALTHAEGVSFGELQAGGQPVPHRGVAEALLGAHRTARAVLGPAHRTGWTVATQAFDPEPGCEQAARDYGYLRDAWYLEVAADDDWVGVQAYTRTRIGPDGPVPAPEGAERTLTGWEYWPDALAEGVRLAHRMAPGTPVLVTENGIATADDRRRIDYTRAALAGLHAAMAEGITVEGYLHWSLLDNYEWGSFAPTFGLVAVDRETFARTPKPSLAWLGRVARNGGLDGED